MRPRINRLDGNAHGTLKTVAALVAAMFASTAAPAFDWSASDLSTQYQDAGGTGGTMPVTNVEQPVGIVLDRSKGGAKRGNDVVLSGDFNDPSKWTSPASGVVVANGVLTATAVAAGTQLVVQANRVVVGKIYEVTYDVLSSSGGAISVGTTAAAGVPGVGVGRFRDVFVAASVNLAIFARSNTTTATVDNVQVRELNGTNLWSGATNVLNGWVDNGDGSYTMAGTNGLMGWGSTPKLIPGRTYEVVMRVSARTSGQVSMPYDGTGANILYQSSTGTFRRILVAPVNAALYIYSNAFVGTIDSISVVEIPGNHLIQPTSASRPTLSARVNALLATQDWTNNSVWNKSSGPVVATIEPSALAPDGTTTVNRLTASATGATSTTQDATAPDTSGVYSIYTKKGNLTTTNFVLRNKTTATNFTFGLFNYDTGTIFGAGWSAEALPNGWYRLSYAYSGVTPGQVLTVYTGFTGAVQNAGDYIFVWGASLTGSTPGTARYQRVTSTTDYDTVGFAKGWRFDGVDDSLYSAANLVLTSTDKLTAAVALTKVSDSASAGSVILELSPTVASNDGSFGLYGAWSTASTAPGIAGSSRGTTRVDAINAGTTPLTRAPFSGTVMLQADIAAPNVAVTANGTPLVSSQASQGTGNFGSYVLNVGRRNNASLPLNAIINSIRGIGARTSPDQVGWLLSQAKLDMNNNL